MLILHPRSSTEFPAARYFLQGVLLLARAPAQMPSEEGISMYKEGYNPREWRYGKSLSPQRPSIYPSVKSSASLRPRPPPHRAISFHELTVFCCERTNCRKERKKWQIKTYKPSSDFCRSDLDAGHSGRSCRANLYCD